MEDYSVISTIFFTTDLAIRIGMAIRVIMRGRSYGVTYAWLIIILLFPIFGPLAYLLFGEARLSERRTKRLAMAGDHYQIWLETLNGRSPVLWDTNIAEYKPIHNLAKNFTGLPAMAKNHLELLENSEEFIQRLVSDINTAQSSCHLQFYIWNEGGQVDRVIDALFEAAQRHVSCKILLDAIGSHSFISSATAKKMQQAGIQIQAALPAKFLRIFFARIDIRNHRKIIIIDGNIAYTGSQNMTDPTSFKKGAGVGQWVDMMVRLQGPVVETLAGTFISDWFLEANGEPFSSLSDAKDIDTIRDMADIHSPLPAGNVAVQLVPSGPGFAEEAIHSLIISAIYSAKKQLILTTPYLIPDNALLTALEAAAFRGVSVTIILPEKNDSRLAGYAARARFARLSAAGIQIYLFNQGFLHSKTITVDDCFALFGSVNLDMRSFWLNYETTLLIYDKTFCQSLQLLQLGYISSSRQLNTSHFANRSPWERFKENAVLMIGPLL